MLRKATLPRKRANRLEDDLETGWDEVSGEVRAVIERHGAQPDQNVLASIVINNHPKVKGRDRDFHVCCSFRAVRREVKDQINQVRASPDAFIGAQTEFKEFSILKRTYNIERDGQPMNLPLETLHFDELVAKADQYQKQSRSLNRESRALLRYAFRKFPDLAARYMAEHPDLVV